MTAFLSPVSPLAIPITATVGAGERNPPCGRGEIVKLLCVGVGECVLTIKTGVNKRTLERMELEPANGDGATCA